MTIIDPNAPSIVETYWRIANDALSDLKLHYRHIYEPREAAEIDALRRRIAEIVRPHIAKSLFEAAHRPTVRTWRFRFERNQQSDSGTFFLDSAGALAVDSGYGGFASSWGSFGPCFRSFLVRMDSDYLYRNLRHRRAFCVDEDATRRRIRRAAWEHFGAGEDFDAELQALEEASFEDIEGFRAWSSETDLPEPWELCVGDDVDHQCLAMCTRLLPRLQARLRLQLARGVP